MNDPQHSDWQGVRPAQIQVVVLAMPVAVAHFQTVRNTECALTLDCVGLEQHHPQRR